MLGDFSLTFGGGGAWRPRGGVARSIMPLL